ncbi:MAG: 16S rRNA (cytosine(1402)-N(4))-methyltransferase RsmH [Chloroflexota bacterium]
MPVTAEAPRPQAAPPERGGAPIALSAADSAGQHVPVLLQEVCDWLEPHSGGTYVDCTVGNGGHAAAILAQSSPNGRLLGTDADPAALEVAQHALKPFTGRYVLICANFRAVKETAQSHGFMPADGVLMDLGFSSRQIEASGRGFSFLRDEPLDMRYDTSQGTTAAHLVNRTPEDDLADLLFQYGEEHRSRRVARAIVARRERAPIRTTRELAELIQAALGGRHGRAHPATKSFQALRIAVNDELGALATALASIGSILRPGGRLAVITFHSLEDRLVKHTFLAAPSENGGLRALTRRPIGPSREEVLRNRRARSAKLRVAERVTEDEARAELAALSPPQRHGHERRGVGE